MPKSPDATAVREQAKRGGFPANCVSQVRHIIDPTTSEWASACRGAPCRRPTRRPGVEFP